jgi:hypothetical protein
VVPVSGERVWILPRTDGGIDDRGNPVTFFPAWDGTGAIPVDHAKVAPRTDLTGEAAIADREAVITNMRVLLRAGSPRPGPLDRMWVRGHEYHVIGEVGEWVNPWRQQETGVDVALKRVEG